MRTTTTLLLLSLTGCVTPTTTTQTVQARRIAFSTAPSAPQGLLGGPGIGLTGHLMAGDLAPGREGNGVSYPRFQPDVGGLFQVQRWVFGGHFSFGAPQFGVVALGDAAPTADDATTWEASLSVGHDVPTSEHFGVSIAGEVGFSSSTLRVTSSLERSTTTMALPTGRLGVGVYGTPGPVRLFGGLSLTTTTWNDATSLLTQTCTFNCTARDTGVFTLAGVAMVGGGVRWQFARGVAVVGEAWVPFASGSVRLPVQLSLTLRVGDFVVATKPRDALTPPPPPPEVAPLPPAAPPPGV
jgi:hypothetical protein